MTDHWEGAIRQAAEQDGEAYCPYCLVAEGTDADPLVGYGNTPVAADRADQDTRTLGDTLHPFGWVCDDHDTFCARDPNEFAPPIDGLLMVVFRGNTGESVMAHIPVHDLDRDRQRYHHPQNADLEHPTAENRSSDSTTATGDQEAATDGGLEQQHHQPQWIEQYDHVIELSDNNAPRSCYLCGDPADYYITDTAKFSCGSMNCRP
jgi:hypothetical protein